MQRFQQQLICQPLAMEAGASGLLNQVLRHHKQPLAAAEHHTVYIACAGVLHWKFNNAPYLRCMAQPPNHSIASTSRHPVGRVTAHSIRQSTIQSDSRSMPVYMVVCPCAARTDVQLHGHQKIRFHPAQQCDQPSTTEGQEFTAKGCSAHTAAPHMLSACKPATNLRQPPPAQSMRTVWMTQCSDKLAQVLGLTILMPQMAAV